MAFGCILDFGWVDDSSTPSPFLFSIILQKYCDDVHSNRDWLFIICRFLKIQLKYLHQLINYTQYCNIIKLSIFLHISLHFKCSIKILSMSHNLKMLSFWSYYILHIKKKESLHRFQQEIYRSRYHQNAEHFDDNIFVAIGRSVLVSMVIKYAKYTDRLIHKQKKIIQNLFKDKKEKKCSFISLSDT